MWPLKTIACFIGFWVLCLLSLFNPIIGVINYMLVYQINPNNTWWGIPLMELGIRFSFLAVLFTVVGMITGRKHVPRVTPIISFWEICVLLLVLIGIVNLITGVTHSPITYSAFEKFWKTILFVLIIGRLVTTRKNMQMMIWALVVGSLYLGHAAYTAPLSSFILGRLDRIGGADFSTTSGAAAHLAAMLPIIGMAFLIARKWRWKIFALVSGAFTVNAIILFRTRSAFVGIVCGAIAALLFAPRVKRYRIQFLILLGLVASMNLSDNFFWERMASLTDQQALQQDAATKIRLEIWAASFQILADYPFGIGPGNFTRIIGQYAPSHHQRASHNSLIVCFVEYGIQGGLVFLMIIFTSIWMLYRSSRLAGRLDHPYEATIMSYAFFISMITYFVTALGTERFYCESFWWILVFPLCLHRMVAGELYAKNRMPALAVQPSEYSTGLIPGGIQYV